MQIILSWGSRSPARRGCHQNIPSDLVVLDFCGVPGEGSVPTSCLSSVSNAGNMLLLHGPLKTSQWHRHPATPPAQFPKGQLITQKLKNQKRTTEKNCRFHRTLLHLRCSHATFKKPCLSAPFSPPIQPLKHTSTCLLVPTLRPRGTPEELGRAACLPVYASRGTWTLATPMLPSRRRERPTTRTQQESERNGGMELP